VFRSRPSSPSTELTDPTFLHQGNILRFFTSAAPCISLIPQSDLRGWWIARRSAISRSSYVATATVRGFEPAGNQSGKGISSTLLGCDSGAFNFTVMPSFRSCKRKRNLRQRAAVDSGFPLCVGYGFFGLHQEPTSLALWDPHRFHCGNGKHSPDVDVVPRRAFPRRVIRADELDFDEPRQLTPSAPLPGVHRFNPAPA
jgi:hypothetical protein